MELVGISTGISDACDCIDVFMPPPAIDGIDGGPMPRLAWWGCIEPLLIMPLVGETAAAEVALATGIVLALATGPGMGWDWEECNPNGGMEAKVGNWLL